MIMVIVVAAEVEGGKEARKDIKRCRIVYVRECIVDISWRGKELLMNKGYRYLPLLICTLKGPGVTENTSVVEITVLLIVAETVVDPTGTTGGNRHEIVDELGSTVAEEDKYRLKTHPSIVFVWFSRDPYAANDELVDKTINCALLTVTIPGIILAAEMMGNTDTPTENREMHELDVSMKRMC